MTVPFAAIPKEKLPRGTMDMLASHHLTITDVEFIYDHMVKLGREPTTIRKIMKITHTGKDGKINIQTAYGVDANKEDYQNISDRETPYDQWDEDTMKRIYSDFERGKAEWK